MCDEYDRFRVLSTDRSPTTYEPPTICTNERPCTSGGSHFHPNNRTPQTQRGPVPPRISPQHGAIDKLSQIIILSTRPDVTGELPGTMREIFKRQRKLPICSHAQVRTSVPDPALNVLTGCSNCGLRMPQLPLNRCSIAQTGVPARGSSSWA